MDAAHTHQLDLPSAFTKPLKRITFAICPTGKFCREDRCQSFFSFELIPSARAPLEECEAAGAIKSAGGIATIIDGPTEGVSDGEFLSRLKHSTPDAIVLVITFGTLEADLAWATKIRQEFPGVPIGLRGTPCYTFEPQIFATCPSIDFCVKGEYEHIFSSIVSTGLAFSPGVSIRAGTQINISSQAPFAENLDSLPFPDRASINYKLYKVRGFGTAQATVRVQRGCPFPCSYCLVHLVSGKKARHRSPKNIVDEILLLRKDGISSFYFRADTFTLDRDWVLSLCDEISSRCPGIRWVTTTRVDQVDYDLILAMKKAGCYGISFGVDVASRTIGKKVHKLADREATERALKGCDKAGIVSLVYIMIGFIWETQETLEEARKFIFSLKPDLLTIHFAHPYPGTSYHQEVIQSKSLIISKRAQAEPALQAHGVSAEDLKATAKRWLLAHYVRPSVTLSLIKKLPRVFLASAATNFNQNLRRLFSKI